MQIVSRFLVSLALLAGLAVSLPAQVGKDSSWVDGPVYDGEELSVDLPGSEHIKNIGSKLDGAGMCVFSSIEMAARAQGLEEMRGWRDWCAAKYAGGGWPQKVDQCLAAWFKAKNIAPIPYLQYEGQSPEQVMELISKTNRMACITYGWSPRYGSRIAHMVCSPLYAKRAVVLDNNFPGETNYEWMEKPELIRRMKLGQGGGAWVFVWLTPGPPAAPKAI